jgi:hypothetical protein
MALVTLNLAALPVKFLAVPVLAGLAAGTGAFAAYVTGPAPAAREPAEIVAALPAGSAAPAPVATDQTAPSRPSKKPSCEQQTWPYIDNRCIARKSSGPAHQVRLVMAPRKDDAVLSSAAAPNLVTSDGVLRGPSVAPEADAPPAVKKLPRHSAMQRSGRNEFTRTYSVYAVPSARSTKPVIVVRPLRLNAYSSRF